ncbi:MAG: hypothetical protein ACT4PO_15355 [Actinomycetota bacterium]
MIVEERALPVDTHPTTIAAPEAPTARWTPLAVVLALLPLAALVELLLVRTFYRVGVYLPKEGPFRLAYRALTATGSFAFNLSSVLAVAALLLLTAKAWRAWRSVAVCLGTFVATTLVAASAGAPGLGPTVRLLFVLCLAAVGWPYVRSGPGGLRRAAVVGIGGALLLSSYAGLAGDAARLVPSAGGPGGGTAAQLAAEALAVAAAFVAFLAWASEERPRMGPIVLGAIPAAALLVAWKANGAITGILVLWTAGLRLYLPMWLYGLALWAFSAAAVGWLPRRPWRSAGLALLLVGGLLLESTYTQTLALLAVVLLTDGFTVGGLPWPGRRAPAT